MANTNAEKNEEEEEDTGVASYSNLKCSIVKVEVVGKDDNRAGYMVMNSDMLVGL